MHKQLSSIQFFNGENYFTAEEHLQERDNIMVIDGETIIALKRNKTLGRLMKNVDTFPYISEPTYEIAYQRTMTLFYKTMENPDKIDQITFIYDSSVFNNFSIFRFIQMGEYPHEDGTMYRLGDLLCYTAESWTASRVMRSLNIGIIPIYNMPEVSETTEVEEVVEPIVNEWENLARQLVIPPILLPDNIPQIIQNEEGWTES
jgi:hypothetical protein